MASQASLLQLPTLSRPPLQISETVARELAVRVSEGFHPAAQRRSEIAGILAGNRVEQLSVIEALVPIFSQDQVGPTFRASGKALRNAVEAVPLDYEVLGYYRSRVDGYFQLDYEDLQLLRWSDRADLFFLLVTQRSPDDPPRARLLRWDGHEAVPAGPAFPLHQWLTGQWNPTPALLPARIASKGPAALWIAAAAAAAVLFPVAAWQLENSAAHAKQERVPTRTVIIPRVKAPLTGSAERTLADVLPAPLPDSFGQNAALDATRLSTTRQALDPTARPPADPTGRVTDAALAQRGRLSENRTQPEAAQEVPAAEPTKPRAPESQSREGRTPPPAAGASTDNANGNDLPAAPVSLTPESTGGPLASLDVRRLSPPAPSHAPGTRVAPPAAVAFTQPVLARQPKPVVIPPDLRRLLSHEVVLSLRVAVDASGRVSQVFPITATSRAEQSLWSVYSDAVKTWTFEPATRNSVPVPGEAILRFRVTPK